MIFLVIFPAVGNREKKKNNNYNEKKNLVQKVWNLATVQIVLQDNFVLQCEVAG